MHSLASAPYAAFDIVVVGTSLGGLAALRQVLSALPGDFPAPIVVVQHLSAEYPSRFPDLLAPHSRLPVQWADHGVQMEPGHVYVAPPGYHTEIRTGGRLLLSQAPKMAFARPSVTPLFASAAETYGARSIAVILTGGGSDGTEGVRMIKERGGRVLVQEPLGAQAWGMPAAALRTGCADFVLPLHRIAPALVTLVMAQGAAALFAVPSASGFAPFAPR
jgi:two-component system chemotaxis response regulator CheB